MATLRPSDQRTYFDVNDSTLTVGASGVAIAAKEDGDRVFLGIYPIAPNQTFNASITLGQPLNGRLCTQQFPLELLHSFHGPLVSKQWTIAAAVNVTVYVVEVFLRRYPSVDLEGLTP